MVIEPQVFVVVLFVLTKVVLHFTLDIHMWWFFESPYPMMMMMIHEICHSSCVRACVCVWGGGGGREGGSIIVLKEVTGYKTVY